MRHMCSKMPEEIIEDIPGMKIMQSMGNRWTAVDDKQQGVFNMEYIIKMNVKDAAVYLQKEIGGDSPTEEIIKKMQIRYDQQRKQEAKLEQVKTRGRGSEKQQRGSNASVSQLDSENDGQYKVQIKRRQEELELELIREEIVTNQKNRKYQRFEAYKP